ncbi:MAG TPA: mandelate racemase/muconate lactonizing enzyme family protein [Nitrososphaerales archaeon]|nr:mandelate racemase/muconate lactonizing enzyme family protein [Nitrososphaerales archaeon]
MKVESIEAYPIRIKAKERLQGGTFSYSYYQTVLVKAVCDGAEGWGEAMTRFEPGATTAMVKSLSGVVKGSDLGSVADFWNAMWKELRIRGHTRGVGVEALSGIEMALYDCHGRLEGSSLCAFFAKTPVDRVKVFAGSLFSSRGRILSQVEAAKAKGMLGAKVKIGFGVEKDFRTLAEVRKAWPEGMVVADANGAYDGKTAAKACRAFRELGLAWFEEPVLSDDMEGYAILKGQGVKVGAGESWFVNDFEEPMAEGLVQVLEPSVSRCGGVGVETEVAKQAAERRLGFSPMTGMNSALSLAASLQVAAAFPSIAVEFNPFPNPLLTDLVDDLPEPSNGSVRVPTRPGIGVTVDGRFVKAHSSK